MTNIQNIKPVSNGRAPLSTKLDKDLLKAIRAKLKKEKKTMRALIEAAFMDYLNVPPKA